jgi:hypothetical protein
MPCIKTPGAGVALWGTKTTTCLHLDGRMFNGRTGVDFRERELPCTSVRPLPRVAAIDDNRPLRSRLGALVRQARAPKPAARRARQLNGTFLL